MRTCDRCLDGRHRCLTDDCACTCRYHVRPNVQPLGELRTPSPSKPTTKPKGSDRRFSRGGRPQQYVGDTRERRAAAMRAARARGVDRAAADAERAADPSGLTWSTATRRLFAADLDRLAAAAAGL